MIWAVLYANGTWRAPDHYVSAHVRDAKKAKPFWHRHDAELFAKLSPGAEVVPHPHPRSWI